MKTKGTPDTRREFLLRIFRLSGISALSVGLGFWFRSRSARPARKVEKGRVNRRPVPPDPELPDMAVVRRGEPAELVTRAVQALGGMKRFVSPGDVVIIKPNLAWDRTPLQAANTNPEVVATLVRLCIQAGAAKVIVGDASCNDARRTYQRSGVAAAAQREGAEILYPEKRYFKRVDIGGSFLGIWPVFAPFMSADKLINVPIAKHHHLTKVTLGMKNFYGVIGGQRHRLHQRIHESIVDLTQFMVPTLTVIDAYRVLMRNGPTGGRLSDTALKKLLIASIDPVAADAYAAEAIWNLRPGDLPFLLLGERRKLGKANYRERRVEEITI